MHNLSCLSGFVVAIEARHEGRQTDIAFNIHTVTESGNLEPGTEGGQMTGRPSPGRVKSRQTGETLEHWNDLHMQYTKQKQSSKVQGLYILGLIG